MTRTSIVAAAIILMTPAAQAQQQIDGFGLELRPFVGAYVPFSAQRHDFKTATTVGAQAAYEWGSFFHLVGTFGWTHGHNKFASLSQANTYIMHYDMGGELNLVFDMSDSWMMRPFIGVGGGGRTYDYGAANVGTRTCTAGYGSIGTEMQSGVVAFRVEARDYLNCFESPITGTKKTRNDGLFSVGVAYHFR